MSTATHLQWRLVAPRLPHIRRWLWSRSSPRPRRASIYDYDAEAFGQYDDDLEGDRDSPADPEPGVDVPFSEAAERDALRRALTPEPVSRSSWLPEEQHRRRRRQERQDGNRARLHDRQTAATMATTPKAPTAPYLSGLENRVWEWARSVSASSPSSAAILRPGDLRETFVRGSGKGGQKVNKTASCVMLKHLPTGLSVRSDNSRSQLRNRNSARQLMRKSLAPLSSESPAAAGRPPSRKSQCPQRKKQRCRIIRLVALMNRASEPIEVVNNSEDDFFDHLGREKVAPRDAQREMVALAMKDNVVAFMPTGTGKTLVAVMLIEKVLKTIAEQRRDDAASVPARSAPRAKVWFLADRVNLVVQQANYISSVTAERIKCVALYGTTGVDSWRQQQWLQVLGNADVIVATPQVLLNALRHAMVQLADVGLLVFDEAHHATSNHPYNRIMHEFYFELDELSRPLVFGMTAVPVKKKGAVNREQTRRMFLGQIRDLESNLNSKIVLPTTARIEETSTYRPTAAEFVVEYRAVTNEIHQDNNTFLSSEEMDELFMNDSPLQTPIDESKIQRIVSVVELSIGSWGSHLCEKRLRGQPLDLSVPSSVEELGLTDKVLQLLAILMTESQQEEDLTGSRFRGIVFTKIRFVAWGLTYLLTIIFQMCELDTMIPGFIVGHTTAGLMTLSRQNLTLQAFRDGAINVLISTNVVEEGLDVPSCNTVIMFDGVDTTLSYLQSSGRARHTTSKYVVIIPSSSLSSKSSLAAAKIGAEVLEELVEFTGRLPITKIAPFKNTHVLRSRTTTARIPTEACVHLLQSYCQSLSDVEPDFVPDFQSSGASATVQLPISSSVRRVTVVLNEFESPSNAKSIVALEALRQLYENGELDENLFPPRRVPVEIFDKELDPTIRGQEITEPRDILRSVRNIGFEGPESLLWHPNLCGHATCSESSIRMHIYVLQDDVPLPAILRPNSWTVSSFALLLCHPLGEVDELPIVTIPHSAPSMTLRRSGTVCLGPEKVSAVRRYVTLLRAIATNRPELAKGITEFNYGYLFVPSVNQEVDWIGIDSALSSWAKLLSWQEQTKDSASPLESMDSLEHSIVVSKHDKHEKFYHTGWFDKSKPVAGPSRMGKAPSLKAYWERHFQLVAERNPQFGIVSWMFCPIDGTRTECQLKNPKPLVPEFCFKIDVSPIAVRMLKRLPTFEKHWTVEVLRQRMKISFPPLQFGRALSPRTSQSCQQQEWDYERLEYLGDTALKLQAGKAAFLNFPNAHEGQLTNTRSDATCNEFLCDIGLKFNIQAAAKMCSISTELKKWPWPLAQYTETLELSQKVLADCIESILGLSYLQCGLEGVDSVMTSLGIMQKLANPDTHLQKTWKDTRANSARLESLEEILNYKFKNRLLAVEALTHGSYMPMAQEQTTRSLERLEYIGDSVIGLVVVEYLYHRFPKLGPENLNIMKDPMVSNDFFGRFVIEQKIHHLIWHNSEPLRNMMDQTDETVADKPGDEDMWEGLPIPKTFADALEASFGAIYCDMNYDYEKAKAVILPLMMPSMEVLSDLEVAKARNPIKELGGVLESNFNALPSYEFRNLTSAVLKTEKVSCTVRCKETFICEARHVDKKKAKHFAAKRAVARIKEGHFTKGPDGKVIEKTESAEIQDPQDTVAGIGKSAVDEGTEAHLSHGGDASGVAPPVTTNNAKALDREETVTSFVKPVDHQTTDKGHSIGADASGDPDPPPIPRVTINNETPKSPNQDNHPVEGSGPNGDLKSTDVILGHEDNRGMALPRFN